MGSGNSRLFRTTSGGKMIGFPHYGEAINFSLDMYIKKFIRGELTWNYLKSLLGLNEYALKKDKYPYSIVVEIINLQLQYKLLTSSKITLSDFKDWVSVVWLSEIFYFTLYERENFIRCLQNLFGVLNDSECSIEAIGDIMGQFGL